MPTIGWFEILIVVAIAIIFLGPNNDKSHLALNHTVKQFKHKYNMSDDDYKLYELIVMPSGRLINGDILSFRLYRNYYKANNTS